MTDVVRGERATAPGRLYVCPTPIGNLEDITLRVLRVLKEVDWIAAEDTRHTQKLLTHFDIRTPLVSCHEYNEATRAEWLVEQMQRGKQVALVSDAGMPGVADPGALVVARAIASGVPVTPLPGANAALTALVASGLSTARFAFEGFLPRRSKERRKVLAALASDTRTLVFYEAPHRIEATLKDMRDVLGDRPACLARELTKVHEEVRRGLLSALVEDLEHRPIKGELVLVVAGSDAAVPALEFAVDDVGHGPRPSAGPRARAAPEAVPTDLTADIMARLRAYLHQGMDKRLAVSKVAAELGVPRRDVYRQAIRFRAENWRTHPSEGESGTP